MALKVFDLTTRDINHWEVDLNWTRPKYIDGDDPSDVFPKEAFEIRGIYRFIREHHRQGFEGGLTERIGIAYDRVPRQAHLAVQGRAPFRDPEQGPSLDQLRRAGLRRRRTATTL